MEFFEIEYILQELEEANKEEEKRIKQQEEEYKKQQAAAKMPRSHDKPDYGGFKVPKINIPSMPKPKF